MRSSGEARLRDVAAFVRSKNAGPFVLTIDVFFRTQEEWRSVIQSRTLSADVVASVYKIAVDNVRIIEVPQANALKISLPRPIPAGDVGELDVAGGQQFAPLLDLPMPTISADR